MRLPLLSLAALMAAIVGCSLDLPEIARNHPANAEAPAGQQYALPAVLEVRPFIRLPNKPTTQTGHPMGHESGGMQHPESADHGGMHVEPHESTRPAHQDIQHAAPRKEGQPMQHMQHEGQRHE